MPEPRCHLAVVAANGLIYAFGGLSVIPGGGIATYIYNPATNTWTTGAPMPTSSRQHFAAVVLNGIIYAIGGVSGSNPLTTVEAYNPSTDAWATKASMQTARADFGAGVINGLIYVLGGGTGSPGSAVAAVEVYNPQTDTWSNETSMPAARSNLGASVLNNVLYAVGGSSTAGGPVATNEAFSVTTPPPPAPPLSTRAFTLVDRGGVSIITDGSGAQTAGYSRILPDPGKTTPTGVAIFGFRNASNILVSETAAPPTKLVSAGRIYAEVAGTLDTGIAVANRNDVASTINFNFTDASGTPAGSGSITIAANQQIAQFLSESPFKVYPGDTFQGTFSFTSSAPVGVLALRGLTNERGDFLMSTLPVIEPTAQPARGTIVVPHFADGGGWITQIFLVNPTDRALTGSLQFVDPNGAPTSLTIASSTSDSFRYAVSGRSSQKLATAGTAAVTASGSVRVVPDGGGTVPVPLVVFSYRPAGVTVTEAGAPVTSGKALRLYVESAGTTGVAGNIQTGIAVANTSSSSASVTFDIKDLNGWDLAGISPVTLTLPGFGQTAKFLADIFPSLQYPFQGLVRITTAGSGISVVGLRARYNERQPTPDLLITTTPPSNEDDVASSAELVFPHLVNGGGFTTQFILFSGIAGQSSSGNLRFLKQDGTPFSLTVH